MIVKKTYPLYKVHVDINEAICEISNVLTSGYVNEGEAVTALTRELSSRFCTDKLVLVNSCTSAITLALELAGVKPGDSVISTPMTCVATNTPIIGKGANVVWADIDPSTGTIDVASVARLLSSSRNVKAVIGVDWAGMPIDSPTLYSMCEHHRVKLIQDAAQAFDARVHCDEHIHKHSHYTTYSFQAIKHFTTGDGGALVCASEIDHKRAKKLKWFGIDRDESKDQQGNWKGQHWNFDISEVGFKFNMNNVAAAIGLSQLAHIDKIMQAHRSNATTYKRMFSASHTVKPLTSLKDSNPSYWTFTVLLTDKIDRDAVLKTLNDEGIMAGLMHVPNHEYSCFKDSYIYLPGVKDFFDHQISLPCGWWLTDADIQHVAKRVLELSDENRRS
jgi:perosamine synthetase